MVDKLIADYLSIIELFPLLRYLDFFFHFIDLVSTAKIRKKRLIIGYKDINKCETTDRL